MHAIKLRSRLMANYTDKLTVFQWVHHYFSEYYYDKNLRQKSRYSVLLLFYISQRLPCEYKIRKENGGDNYIMYAFCPISAQKWENTIYPKSCILWTLLAAGLQVDLVGEEWKRSFKRQTILLVNGESDQASKGYCFCSHYFV